LASVAGAFCCVDLRLSFEAIDGRGVERGGTNNCSARVGKQVDVRRRCRKRQNINQLG
jgi:hypothetical protein